MKWIFFTGLLLVSLLGLSPLFSLTEEEKATLPSLSKEKLIQIIMIYDQQLTEIESNLTERESLLIDRETALTKKKDLMILNENALLEREKTLTETESHLKLRESLLAESYRLQKEANSQNFWTGIVYGAGGGIILGAAGSFLLSR